MAHVYFGANTIDDDNALITPIQYVFSMREY